MIGFALPLILLLFFIWARATEFFRLKKLLRDGTTQAIHNAMCRHRFIGPSLFHHDALREFAFAVYELGSTRSQRYVFKLAVLSEIPSLAPYVDQLMRWCPHPKCTLKTLFIPAI